MTAPGRVVARAAVAAAAARGWIAGAVAVMAAAGLMAGPLAGPSGAAATGVRTRSVTVPGPFSPDQLVAAAGKVWLLGPPAPATRQGCVLESVDPATMATGRPSHLADTCGTDAVAGGGRIYADVLVHVGTTNTNRVHVERVDPSTGRATLLAPVVMTLAGSEDAHTAFAYAGGSLWLWGDAAGAGGGGGEEVVQISPASGAVVHAFTGSALPAIGDLPRLLGTGGTLWLAGGPGGGAVVARITPGAAAPVVAYRGPAGGTVQWLAAAGGRVWAAVETFPGGGAAPSLGLVQIAGRDDGVPGGAAASTGTANAGAGATAGSGSGAAPATGPGAGAASPSAPSVLATPAGSAGELWAAGWAGDSCASPLRLWRISAVTGSGRAVATLPTGTTKPCLAEARVATAGAAAFVLVAGTGRPAELWRVTG